VGAVGRRVGRRRVEAAAGDVNRTSAAGESGTGNFGGERGIPSRRLAGVRRGRMNLGRAWARADQAGVNGASGRR